MSRAWLGVTYAKIVSIVRFAIVFLDIFLTTKNLPAKCVYCQRVYQLIPDNPVDEIKQTRKGLQIRMESHALYIFKDPMQESTQLLGLAFPFTSANGGMAIFRIPMTAREERTLRNRSSFFREREEIPHVLADKAI